MKSPLDLLRATRAYELYRRWRVRRRGPIELEAWESSGRPVPVPHLAKQRVILEYARTYGIRTLVETGTYYGDMVAALESEFDRILSIELQPRLVERARRRFADEPKISIIFGDSGEMLAQVVPGLVDVALFWLDGHYSGGETARGTEDTPVLRELANILRAGVDHVVLIDDARLFGVDAAYPTLAQVADLVETLCSGAVVSVSDDVIRIVSGH